MIAGAAWESKRKSIIRLLEYGLLRDSDARKLVQLDYEEVERRLKERNFGRDE